MISRFHSHDLAAWRVRPMHSLAMMWLLLPALVQGAGEPVAVVTLRPTRGDIVRYVTLPGTLRANQQVTLQARVAGFVKSIAVDRGDVVKAGQSLAEIEVPELVAERAKQVAETRVAEREFHRLEAARAQAPDLITAQVLDAATGRWEIARAQLEHADTLLRYASVTAPFAGVVTARFVDPGAFVPAGSGGPVSAIVTLADTAVLRAQVAVPEAEAIHIRVGQPVRVTLEGLNQKVFAGTISRHSGALDDATRTLWVEADLPNGEAQLRPGMYATLRLGVERHTGVLLIPTDALVMEKSSAFVFVVDGGRSRKRPVKLGFQDGPATELIEGLTAEAVLISPGKAAPVDGTVVRSQENK